MTDPKLQRDLLEQAKATLHWVKRKLAYHGSKKTEDFVQVVVLKWLERQDFDELAQRRREDRSLETAAHDAVVDEIRRMAAAKRTGKKVDIDDLDLPSQSGVMAAFEDAWQTRWLTAQIERLKAGRVDARVTTAPPEPAETGAVLELIFAGHPQAEIARVLEVSEPTVTRRKVAGEKYLATLAMLDNVRTDRDDDRGH